MAQLLLDPHWCIDRYTSEAVWFLIDKSFTRLISIVVHPYCALHEGVFGDGVFLLYLVEGLLTVLGLCESALVFLIVDGGKGFACLLFDGGRLSGEHLVPCPHEPGAEVDVLVGVVEFGTVPCGVLLEGDFLLKDEDHVIGGEVIIIIEATDASVVVAYPVPGTAGLEELLVDQFAETV